nr:NAD-dependent epimerase/dehydratase family protein [Desulfobulbaceae bacterium]
MKKALVTGGGGFVGSAIVKRLVSMGVTPVIVGRSEYPKFKRLPVEICIGDIRDSEFLVKASANCDTVFHVAAKAGVWGSRDEYFSINHGGTKNVIYACQKNNISNLIYTSTPSVVFNDADIINGDEALPYSSRPLCHYAESKIAAEKEVLSATSDLLKTVSLRPHLIWGPGDTNLIPRLVMRGKKGLVKQVGAGDNSVDIVYIDNVVDAHIQAALSLETDNAVAGKAYFISQGEPVNLWQWINCLYERLGIPQVSNTISFRRAYYVGMLMEYVFAAFRIKKEPLMTRFVAQQLAKSHWFSIEAARKDFGYAPLVSTSEGMDRLALWVKKQEWFKLK